MMLTPPSLSTHTVMLMHLLWLPCTDNDTTSRPNTRPLSTTISAHISQHQLTNTLSPVSTTRNNQRNSFNRNELLPLHIPSLPVSSVLPTL